jgi:hypothetical protein
LWQNGQLITTERRQKARKSEVRRLDHTDQNNSPRIKKSEKERQNISHYSYTYVRCLFCSLFNVFYFSFLTLCRSLQNFLFSLTLILQKSSYLLHLFHIFQSWLNLTISFKIFKIYHLLRIVIKLDWKLCISFINTP